MTWQKKLAQGFSSVNDLLDFLSLPRESGSEAAEKQFKTRVPRGFAARMEPANPKDPLLLQVLAQGAELESIPGYVQDPLEEASTNTLQGLIHKYHGRVLLTLTGTCAINCRYCFRRHFPYQANNPGRQGWQLALDYIQQDPNIHEVILSGGDPMLASDQVIDELITALEQIKHVKTLRFHTRIPIVLPDRVNHSFLEQLQKTRLNKVIVLHCNHANELDGEVLKVCKALRAVGCQLLNQSVLLRGVNDNVDSLTNLSHKLFDFGILPYYLHLLDKVAGASHFDMPEEEALNLHLQLQARLPGYLVPRLAREEPGKPSKTLVSLGVLSE